MKKASAIALRLLSRICFGVMLTAPAIVAANTLVACADENDPQTWVKRLDDPAQRVPATKRLEQFFNDAMAASNNNRDDEKVKKIVDVAVEPLSKTYTAGGLDDKTRKELMKLLSDMGDVRAAPAFAKAFQDYEAGKTDEDVKYAAQGTTRLAALGKIDNQALIDALWECFSKYQPSKTKQLELTKSISGAVLAVKHPSYGPKAVEKLAMPVSDPKNPDEALDKVQFWQATSARLIGEIKFTPAVKPLVTALLTPTKGDLVFPIRQALMRMPKESEPVLIAALKGTDADLAKLGEAFPEKAHLARIAEPLAYISRPTGRDAILETLAKADSDANRVVLGSMLTHFPSDPKIVKAYLDAYNKVQPNSAIALMGGGNGRAILAQSAANLFDTNLTEWLVRETANARGEAADAMPPAALQAAIKLMTASQTKVVGDGVNKIPGQAVEKDMFKAASAVVDKCKQDAACYLGVLDTPIPSTPPAAKMGHVKAAWMAAIYGNAETKKALLDKIEKIKDGSVRLAMAEAIDHLAASGDSAAADKLEKIVDADTAAGVKAATDELYRIALKLRSRSS
jgi:hypothetical protein